MISIIEANYQQYQQQILAIREQVFIVEQGVPPELEVDEQDPLAQHVLLFIEQAPIATGRLTAAGHIGRVAVLKPYRHQSYGRQIILKLEHLAVTVGLTHVELGAQCQALRFYQGLGYHAVGEVFMDAGIEHLKMTKLLV